MSTEKQREKWRRQKRAQRAKNPTAEAAKRRQYYAANLERMRDRARRYYREVWKFKSAGVVP